MSWCNREAICALVETGRLNPHVLEETRRQADLEFIHLCQTGVNIGDVLILNALDSQIPIGIRLTSVLAVEPLITMTGWMNGNQFSDKAQLLSRIWKYLLDTGNSSLALDPANLVTAILRVAAKILILEFPAEKWEELLTNMFGDAAVFFSGGYRLDFLVLVTSQCGPNTLLWLYLTEKVQKCWWKSLLDYSSAFRSTGFEVLWNLVKARPKNSALQSSSLLNSSRPHQLLLLEPSLLMNGIIEVLRKHQQETEARVVDERERCRYFKEVEWLLLIAQSLAKTEEQAHFLFQFVSFFLIRFQYMYLSELPLPSEGLSGGIQTSLSCLQYILITFSEVDFECIGDTIQTVMMYLIRVPSNCLSNSPSVPFVDDEDYTEEEMSRLKQHIMEEEVVPLGCGGDDVPSLAGCILELFLEKNFSQCVPLLSSLFLALEQVSFRGGGPQAVFSFFSKAIFHIGRVGVMDSRCLAHDLTATNSSFFSQLYSMVWSYGSSNPLPCATLVYGASQLFFFYGSSLTTNTVDSRNKSGLCDENDTSHGTREPITSFFNFLEQVYHAGCAHSKGSTSHEFLAGIAIYSIAAILQHAVRSPSSSAHYLVRESWWNVSFENASKASSHIQLFASCELISAIMALRPEMKYFLPQFDDCFLSVINNFCDCSTVRAIPALLTEVLKQLLDHQNDGLCSTMRKGFRLLGERCCSFISHSTALVLRQVSLMIVDVTTDVYLRHSQSISRPSYCEGCFFCLVSGFLPLLCQFANTMGPFDEGTTSSFSACFSTSTLAFHAALHPQAEQVLQSTCHILAGSTQERHPSSTISGVCSSVAIQLLSICRRNEFGLGLLGYVGLSLEHVFSVSSDETYLIEGRKGVNYLGAMMLLSVAFIQHPSACLQYMMKNAMAPSVPSEGAGELPQQERCCRAWQRALGWSCSLARFADDITWSYILSGWLSLLSCVLSLPPDQRETIFFTPLSYLTVFAFPSAYSKKVPPKVWPLQSVGGALATGLLLVKHSYSRATRLSGFRKELHHLLLIKDVIPCMSSKDTFLFEAFGLASLFPGQVSQSQSAQAVLQKLSEFGLQSLIQLQEQDSFFSKVKDQPPQYAFSK